MVGNMRAECFDSHRSLSSISCGMTEPATAADAAHIAIEPKIIYPGTPVALISTINPDGSANLAPMSSFWALGRTAMLGFGRNGQTCANLGRTGECVINFPGPELWQAVERLAPLSGRNPPPPHVIAYGGRFEPDKFGSADLTPLSSHLVRPPRVQECHLHLEAKVVNIHSLEHEASAVAVETRILQVHASPAILEQDRRHIAPASWQPLLYNFRRYHGLSPELGRSFREGR
jgi:flavin reductase (DIM6/NTAB) family NADH-FMN oxidoreductase RutF